MASVIVMAASQYLVRMAEDLKDSVIFLSFSPC
jgi:hypothetical protein